MTFVTLFFLTSALLITINSGHIFWERKKIVKSVGELGFQPTNIISIFAVNHTILKVQFLYKMSILTMQIKMSFLCKIQLTLICRNQVTLKSAFRGIFPDFASWNTLTKMDWMAFWDKLWTFSIVCQMFSKQEIECIRIFCTYGYQKCLVKFIRVEF